MSKANHVVVELSHRQVEVLLEAVRLSPRETTGALRHAVTKLEKALHGQQVRDPEEAARRARTG